MNRSGSLRCLLSVVPLLLLVATCTPLQKSGQFECFPSEPDPCPDGMACVPFGPVYECHNNPHNVCPNGELEANEQCDGELPEDFPPDTCERLGFPGGIPRCIVQSCRIHCSVCGNGILDFGETCDDGNADSCDGCSSTCQVEACGNGVQECDEQCDDGNQDEFDGCSTTCRTSAVWQLVPSSTR